MDLKTFLTHKRSQISPRSVGLNGSKTRRSKGLTREDMAELTGVSFKWYTLFESGATKGVSRRLAQRVADVLNLPSGERHYLFGLLGFADQPDTWASQAVPPALRRLVHEMTGVAAALYSPLFDVLDCNASYAALFPPALDGPAYARNKLWRLFNDPSFRAAWLDWDAVTVRVLGDFRYMSANLRHTSEYAALLDAMNENADFRRIWALGEVAHMGDPELRFRVMRPDGQPCVLEVAVLTAMSAPGVYLAALLAEPMPAPSTFCS